MQRETKILITAFIVFSFASIAFSYWRYAVKQEYEVIYDQEMTEQNDQMFELTQ